MSGGADATLARTSASLDQLIDVETPEQVVLSYTVAGVGSRAAAALIDYAILAATSAALWVLAAMILPVLIGKLGGSAMQRMGGSWVIALLILTQFALMWGYYVFFEAVWDGQTPGKRQVGLRVVQDGGYSVSFGASAVRNLARIVDMQPLFVYAVGMVSVAVSKSGKRLGDMLAGTIVVRERAVQLGPVAVENASDAVSAPRFTAVLTDAEFDLLDRFVDRSGTIDPAYHAALAAQLADRFREPLASYTGSDMRRLAQLAAAERQARAHGVAARGETGAARERHAIVSLGTPRWRAFAALLTDAQRRGLAALSEEEVREFVARYREASTDLARLRTAARGRETDAAFYLGRLVGAAHNLVYTQRRVVLRAAGRYVAVSVPREIRRSAGYILFAALLLFGPAAATFLAVVRRPALASELLPAGMIDRAATDAAACRSGHCQYIPVEDFERPVMASSIMSNNIQVTYAVFAFGITYGVLTVFMLVLNGVSIGAAAGLFASQGIGRVIFDFVAAHSVFELSAICIAAGGGLLVAAALLLPGARTRREALVVNGRRAIRLLTASTLLLILAGTLEGLVSPRTDIPFGVKLAIAGACAVLLAIYVNLGRGAGEGGPREEFAYSDDRALISR